MSAPIDSRKLKTTPLLLHAAKAWLLVLCLATPLLAGEPYLAAGHPDGVALLAPPPAPGSEEEAADLEEARAVFKGRTPAEEARAMNDSKMSFALFAPAVGSVFEPGKLPRTHALLQQVKGEIAEIINGPKEHWQRKRPYQLDASLRLGKPEADYGYPSGHSTRGTVYALILAELFPDKQEAILAVGRELGWDRVLLGKHFPTDVQAGRVLGKAIARELLASTTFQHDLAQAKAEIAQTQAEKTAGLEPAASH